MRHCARDEECFLVFLATNFSGINQSKTSGDKPLRFYFASALFVVIVWSEARKLSSAMSSKRDRDSGSDELCESTRTTPVPRHHSATSIAETPSHDDVPSLVNIIQQLRLQLLQEQHLREQSEQELQEIEKQFQLEKTLREQEKQLRQQEQQLREQEQQLREQEQHLREQQERRLMVERQQRKQLDAELHDLATRLHREQNLREQQQRELVLELHRERQLRAEEQRLHEASLHQLGDS